MKLDFIGTLDRDGIYRTLDQLKSYSLEAISVIDLSRVTFVEPYGLVLLLQILDMTPMIRDIIFPNRQTLTYMARTSFLDYLSKKIDLPSDIEHLMQTMPRDPNNKTLIDITKISDKGDIRGTLHYVRSQVSNILINDLGYTEQDISDFLVLLSETLDNIRRHSFAYGYVCAQTYRFSGITNLKYIKVCISDRGIGIKQSFADTRKAYQRLGDAESLKLAVIEETSSKELRGQRGGNGYKGIKEIIKRLNGYIIVKSGEAQIIVDRNHYELQEELPYFPGTQIEIVLPCKIVT